MIQTRKQEFWQEKQKLQDKLKKGKITYEQYKTEKAVLKALYKKES